MASKKETTIQSIVNTAVRLFSTYGYTATTTSLIAGEAGVSEAIIFKYFKSKENLLKEISKIAISQIIENISIIPFVKNIEQSKDYPLKDFIKSIIKERFEFIDKNHELIKLLFLEMQYSADLKNQAKEIVFPKVAEIFGNMKQILVKKGDITDIKACAAARIILGLIESVIIQKYFLDIETSKQDIAKETEEILNILERGLK